VDILKYKDYEGTAELDMTRGVCRGKILFIKDLVTYEADTPSNLQNEFEAAVNDYLETCSELGREPQKPLKGQFNVRVPPNYHKAAILRALKDSVTLNDVVVSALGAYLAHHDVDVSASAAAHYRFITLGMHQSAVTSASAPLVDIAGALYKAAGIGQGAGYWRTSPDEAVDKPVSVVKVRGQHARQGH